MYPRYKCPDVCQLLPFYQVCIRHDVCGLGTARFPKMHFSQQHLQQWQTIHASSTDILKPIKSMGTQRCAFIDVSFVRPNSWGRSWSEAAIPASLEPSKWTKTDGRTKQCWWQRPMQWQSFIPDSCTTHFHDIVSFGDKVVKRWRKYYKNKNKVTLEL